MTNWCTRNTNTLFLPLHTEVFLVFYNVISNDRRTGTLVCPLLSSCQLFEAIEEEKKYDFSRRVGLRRVSIKHTQPKCCTTQICSSLELKFVQRPRNTLKKRNYCVARNNVLTSCAFVPVGECILEPAAIWGSATGGTSTFDFNVHLWRPQPWSRRCR